MIDNREREFEVAKRRMWLPALVLASLFVWTLCYGFVLLVAELVGAAASVFSP